MTINESSTDRIVRGIVGALTLVGAVVVGASGGGTVLTVALGALGVILVGTAAVGFCPLYRVVGISTCKVPAARG
ncbi:DUF2892 domain-containing protein [Actinotalea sp.]|uniref:YgaP family membrane protein n=1 Tax=Actinotalea sp. TaxID=1872145 RepID=UPI00356722D9